MLNNNIPFNTRIKPLFNRLKKPGFILHEDGIRLKELQGDTENERDADFKRYKEYVDLVDNLPVFKGTKLNDVIQVRPGMTFADLIAKYSTYKKTDGWEDKQAFKQGLTRLELIRDLIGGDILCSDLTIEHADKFLEKILKIPKNRNKGKLALMSLEEKLELPDSYSRLSKASLSKHIDLLKSVTKYGVSLDKEKAGGINPLKYDFASHLIYKFNKKTDSNSYLPFTKTELQKLFSGYVYQYGSRDRKRKSDDYIFWAPLIAAYSGARVNEVAQLLVSDIRQDDETGIWYFNILDDELERERVKEKKQSVKSNASRRKVPVHQTLLDLGFLDFVHMTRSGKHSDMLFSTGLIYYEKGKWGKNISDWFNGDSSRGTGYKTECGIERNTGKVFHSFRHAFGKTLLSSVGPYVDISRIGALMGHEEMKTANASSITLIYTGEYSLEILQKAINTINFRIDISHVNYQKFLKKFERI